MCDLIVSIMSFIFTSRWIPSVVFFLSSVISIGRIRLNVPCYRILSENQFLWEKNIENSALH